MGMQTQTFLDWFGLDVPIIQAPIGSIATVALAQQVAAAGGVGTFAMTWADPAVAAAQAQAMHLAAKPFFANLVLHFGTEKLAQLIGLKPASISFSWGVDPRAIRLAQAHGIKVGVQVGSLAGAMAAINAGADYVIVQGIEAGGHVQSSTPLQALLPAVLAQAGEVPVVAAGGLATPEDCVWAITSGAAAVMLGTVFVASAESNAHPDYKRALVNAQAADTVYTNCFDLDWPYAMHRVLRNGTFEKWEAAGCPAAPHRPGEGDIVASAGGRLIRRYCDTPPDAMATGAVLDACLYAGMGVEHITRIEPAFDITRHLWDRMRTLI
jgi:nitronate monooxygenase